MIEVDNYKACRIVQPSSSIVSFDYVYRIMSAAHI